MCKIVGALFLFGLGMVLCHPAKDALMFEMGGDTAVVESTVREARQAPAHLSELLKPGIKAAFILTYGNKEGDVGDVQGYSKKLNDRGNEGYEHYDSFHKKDADKFGFEVHREFGKSDKAGVDVDGKKSGYSEEEKEEAEESKTLYRISEEPKENEKKNQYAVDDDDSSYYGGGGSNKSGGGESENESDGGGSGNYEVNETYESGGSTSYEGGHKKDSGNDGNYSSGSGEGKSQSYSADADEEEEDEDDD